MRNKLQNSERLAIGKQMIAKKLQNVAYRLDVFSNRKLSGTELAVGLGGVVIAVGGIGVALLSKGQEIIGLNKALNEMHTVYSQLAWGGREQLIIETVSAERKLLAENLASFLQGQAQGIREVINIVLNPTITNDDTFKDYLDLVSAIKTKRTQLVVQGVGEAVLSVVAGALLNAPTIFPRTKPIPKKEAFFSVSTFWLPKIAKGLRNFGEELVKESDMERSLYKMYLFENEKYRIVTFIDKNVGKLGDIELNIFEKNPVNIQQAKGIRIFINSDNMKTTCFCFNFTDIKSTAEIVLIDTYRNANKPALKLMQDEWGVSLGDAFVEIANTLSTKDEIILASRIKLKAIARKVRI